MNKISRNRDEVDESYERRKWFINEIKPKTKEQYNEAIILSNVWINMLLLGCIYPKNIIDKIKIILKNSKF